MDEGSKTPDWASKDSPTYVDYQVAAFSYLQHIAYATWREVITKLSGDDGREVITRLSGADGGTIVLELLKRFTATLWTSADASVRMLALVAQNRN